jgi:D-xylose 1-dehydrogenase (NADP+, D-xylono-1,5-lactone-forming)
MTGQLQFADARTASFDCGFTLPFRGWLEITGTKGVIRVPEMWLPRPKATWEVELNGEPAVAHAIEGEDQMVHMLDDFAQAVWADRDPSPVPDDAVKTLRVLDALKRSVREGREVDV